MIEVKDLYFTYPGTHEAALCGIDFTISKGEVFGFLGPSGAGKSTTQKILIGILKNYLGSVRVMGTEVKNTKAEYFEHIGVAFEFPNFYTKFTALENLKLFRSLYAGKTEDPMSLLKQVDLADAADVKVSKLSKGMKMRLNFCRALLNHPQILFLDEPTSGLDPVNAKRMKDLILDKKSNGTTIILTTHNMQAAEELCDRVAFIVDGQIKLINSPRELKLLNGNKRLLLEYRQHNQLQQAEFLLDGIGENQQFLQLIKEYPIETVHSLEASLEQIFIHVTGRSLV